MVMFAAQNARDIHIHMLSLIVRTVRGLAVILITGTIGLPTTLPCPVGKVWITAPPAAISVTHSAAADELSMKYRPFTRFRRLGGLQNVDVLRRAADLFQVSKRLFFDGGQATFDVAFGGLAVGEVIGLVREDHVVLIGLPHLVPALANFCR